MIGESALALDVGADAVDIGKTSIPTPRWVTISAWRRKWRTGWVRTCRHRGSYWLGNLLKMRLIQKLAVHIP
jgi:hypothetical protein